MAAHKAPAAQPGPAGGRVHCDPMRIGPYVIDPPVVLAPMAGVTDKPFRQLCRRLGAGLAVSEMTSADPRLRHTRKSCLRRDHAGEPAPVSVQIAGYDAGMMAEAARANVAEGAQLIDINMGCPAKKICNVMAGSALLRDEPLVRQILEAVVNAVPSTPVTLKIRTGWDKNSRNALNILKIAEQSGIRALAMHGRTRACGYSGQAEYETIQAAKAVATIPIIANGDIDSPEQAKHVLDTTHADALMIGRAAQGRPWLFREIEYFLNTGTYLPPPRVIEIHEVLLEHLEDLYLFYGVETGVGIARKHISWYTRGLVGSAAFRHRMNQLPTIELQRQAVNDFFCALADYQEHLSYARTTPSPHANFEDLAA